MKSPQFSSALVLLGVLALALSSAYAQGAVLTESFESGLGSWEADAHMPEGRWWTVTRTQEAAFDGEWSLAFTADGRSDDGTVWIVRESRLPVGTWNIGLDFWFWSRGSDVNNWRVVAYIGIERPEVEADFTSVGYAGIEGWSSYAHEATLVLDTPTTVYVALGYSINWETIRTHYFDKVTITGAPCETHAGDMDYDCDVDLTDFATFALCFGGTTESPVADCTSEQARAADLDEDGVIDLNDFATFAAGFTG